MKNHELLNLIGDVNEDYVLEAGNNVVRPRFRWKTLAACAACAALIAAAYPVYRASHPALHGYTVVEGGALATLEDVKTPAKGEDDPVPNPAGDEGPDGEFYTPGGDAPSQEAASEQYDKLLKGMGLHGEGKWSGYPAWFAGAWIEGENLVVAIVEDSRTPELEAKIREWTEGDILFRSAKYSHNFLDGLMDPVSAVLDGTGLSCGFGVDVAANCLGIDLYSDGAAIPDSILAELARLDPDGDAIRVRLFTQSMSTLTDEIMKGPAPGQPAADPPVPGGAQSAEDLPEAKEAGQPAVCDLPGE